MRQILIFCFILILPLQAIAEKANCPDFLNAEKRKLNSKKTVNLCEHYKKNKPILIVNTASHCGFTKQFTGLEALYNKYKSQDLVILGFPSHDFMNQEEKTEAGTASICYKNYGVTFPMFSHTKVKGDKADPLFKYLAAQTKKPSWNFNKYLIGKDGAVTHFGSRVKPLDSDIENAVKANL